MAVHNRKELLAWLDGVIEASQRAHNFHLVSDDDDALSASVAGVDPGSPVALPTFITFRRACSQQELSPNENHGDALCSKLSSWRPDMRALRAPWPQARACPVLRGCPKAWVVRHSAAAGPNCTFWGYPCHL